MLLYAMFVRQMLFSAESPVSDESMREAVFVR
jgi:hypothetical protein